MSWTDNNITDPQGTFGQGAANNSISWGQSAVNTISWGWGHIRSLGHAVTNLLGTLSDPAFKMTVDTTITGATPSDTIQLAFPTFGGDVFDFVIDWGDGVVESVSGINLGTSVSHTYSVGGIYQIAITGVFPFIRYNNTSDKLKIISIDNWGDIVWGSFLRAFYGCTNLTTSNAGVPNLSACASIDSVFRNCVNHDNTSLFTGVTSAVTDFDNAFESNFVLKQDISNINIQSATTMANFLIGSDINNVGTSTNYDNLLLSLRAQAELYGKTGIVFHGGNSKYSVAAATARAELISTYTWTITDGGAI